MFWAIIDDVCAEKRQPWHVAYHFLGGVRHEDDKIYVQSLEAPRIEAIADLVDRLTLVVYEQPEHPTGEDVADAPLNRSNVDVVSLGPKGSWRDSAARRTRVGRIVAEASSDWDVLVHRLPNRRIHIVDKANRCPRTVVIDGSCVGDEARTEPGSLSETAVRRFIAAVTDRRGRRVIGRAGLTFVNSKMLAGRHRGARGRVLVTRWSRRRSDEEFVTDDRLGTSTPTFMIAARLVPYKGVFEAVDAFIEIKRSIFPNARLEVAGKGQSEAQLVDRVAAAGFANDVVFHGWMPGAGLFDLYRRADVLIHAAYAESFPRVINEALAHSVLVICTPVGGILDFLEDGRDVTIVESHSVGAIVAAVRALADDADMRRKLLSEGRGIARDSAVDVFAQRFVTEIATTWPDLTAAPEPA